MIVLKLGAGLLSWMLIVEPLLSQFFEPPFILLLIYLGVVLYLLQGIG